MTSAPAAELTEATEVPASTPGDQKADRERWTIAQIAQEFDVTHRTVRHYEELGLITPQRRGTVRVYRRRDRVRLALILCGRRIGFPLEQIRTIINMYDTPSGEAGQLRYLLEQIQERRADIERRRADLEAILAELETLQRRCAADLRSLQSAGPGR